MEGPRFSLLHLDASETHLADAVVHHAAAHHAPHHPLPRSYGKLHICSRSLIFEPDLQDLPLLRFPFKFVTNIQSVPRSNLAEEAYCLEADQLTTLLHDSKPGPYRQHPGRQRHTFTTIRSQLGPIKPLISFLLDAEKQGRSDEEAASLMEEREAQCYFNEPKLAASYLARAHKDAQGSKEEEDQDAPARCDPGRPQVLAWGYNNGGQLGVGTSGLEASPAPLHAFRGLKAAEVACGGSVEYHTAVVTEEGQLYTCGCGQCGQLGHGEPLSLALPKPVEALQSVIVDHVACGSAHTVVVTQGGAVWSWGWGSFGQLGHGHTLDLSTPAKVAELAGLVVTVVACGSAHTAAVSDDGSMYTWGWGMSGQLGHGDEGDCAKPRQVRALQRERITHIACGLSHTVAAASSSKSTFSWGSDENGQLGHGRFDFVSAQRKRLPRAIRALQGKDVRGVACGSTFTLAMTVQRELFAWGTGDDGQLGQGQGITTRRAPTQVAGVRGVVMVGASGSHSLAITEQGRLYSWGLNHTGQLGLGDLEPQWTPTEVMRGAGLSFRFMACAGEGVRGHSVAIATASPDAGPPGGDPAPSMQPGGGAGLKIRCQAKACVHVPYAEVAGVLCVSTRGLHFRPFSSLLDDDQVGLEIFLSDDFGVFAPRNSVRTAAGDFASERSVLLSFATTADREAMLSALHSVMPDEHHHADEAAELQRVQDRWLHGESSNFEYLMELNVLADRSLNDLSQYPVFPWVLVDYHSDTLDLSDPCVYRDLSKPVGALNDKRMERLLDRYRDMAAMAEQGSDDDCVEEPYMYGTHYSAPLYVMFYLLRQAPELTLHNRGGTFDRPDRTFYSVPETFKGVCSNDADVKELIPEFYGSDGGFLLNSQGLDLGARQDGSEVGDVELPPWAKDAADFVQKMREALESEHVTQQLHCWIDLVFGFQQNGEEAVAACNVFHPRSYHGKAQWEAVRSGFERRAMREQVQEYGQCPRQLFHAPHPSKNSK